jgi:hypothetical protein
MSESVPSKTRPQQEVKKTEIVSSEMTCILCKQKFYMNQKHECGVKDNEKIVRIR